MMEIKPREMRNCAIVISSLLHVIPRSHCIGEPRPSFREDSAVSGREPVPSLLAETPSGTLVKCPGRLPTSHLQARFREWLFILPHGRHRHRVIPSTFAVHCRVPRPRQMSQARDSVECVRIGIIHSHCRRVESCWCMQFCSDVGP